MKITKLTVLCFCVAFSSLCFGQRKADKTYTFQGNIEALLLNPYTGDAIVKEADVISDINPQNADPVWKLTKDEVSQKSILKSAVKAEAALSSPDLTAIFKNTDRVEFIPNSPYLKATFGNSDIVVNSLNGEVDFNSSEIGSRIMNGEFIPDEDAFLFLTTDGKVFKFVYYSLSNKQILWTTDLGTTEKLGAVFSAMFKRARVEDRIISADGNIYTSLKGYLYALDKGDGHILWQTAYPVGEFYLSQNKEKILIITNEGSLLSSKQKLNVLDVKTGAKLWSDDISTKFISYVEDWTDRVLVATNSGFNFYSYATGDKLWKKDPKGSNIKKVIPVDADYLYIADNEMNLIDENGVSKWKKFVEIADDKEDPVYYLGKVDNNRVLYLTGTYGNMVDYTGGKKIWKKNIEFDKKSPLVYDYDENRNIYLAYNNKKIYKFDPNADDAPAAIGKKLSVSDDKSIASIEMFDWGICLVGQKDVIGVDFSGNEKYHNRYKEPGEFGRQSLKAAGIIGTSYLGLRAGANKSLANATYTIQSRTPNGQLVTQSDYLMNDKSRDKMLSNAETQSGAAATIQASLLNRVDKRYNALKQNENYAFVFTKGDDGNNLLVKVRKSDGQEVDKIIFDNNRPIYEIDPVTEDIYYVYKNELRIFSKQ